MMFDLRFEAEEMIKCCDAVHTAEGKLQCIGNIYHQIVFEKSKNPLCNMQNLDQCIAACVMLGDGTVEQLESVVAAWMVFRFWLYHSCCLNSVLRRSLMIPLCL